MNFHTVDTKSQRIFSLLCDVERGRAAALTSEERGELLHLQRNISWSKARMEKRAAQIKVVVVAQREPESKIAGYAAGRLRISYGAPAVSGAALARKARRAFAVFLAAAVTFAVVGSGGFSAADGNCSGGTCQGLDCH